MRDVDHTSGAITSDRAQARFDADSLRVLVDSNPDGVLVVDSDGTVCFANPAAELIFGRGGASVVGEPFGVPVVAGDTTDIDVPRADGTGIDVHELRVAATTWAGHDARLVTVRDVTERVASEARITELNRELQLRAEAANVLRHVGDGVILLDDDDVVQFWNAAAERVLAVSADDAVGRSVADVVPGWRHVEHSVLLDAAPFEDKPRGQSVVLEVDGEELWLSVTGVQFAGGVVYAFHDLTEEVRLDSLKRDFVATASHELRTPLTSIQGAAHTLRRTELSLDEGARSELLEVICTQSERLQRLTEDILTTRKLQEEGPRITVERFDAAALAADVLLTVGAQAHDGIRLLLDDQLDGHRELESDPDKLRQVLVNLVQNAVKYSPGGGEVRLAVRRLEDSFQFEVHDEGMGIARSELELVFDKFYRAPDNQRHAVAGTGLGLYIARELLRRLDGNLWVDSRLGSGSTFYVAVPIRTSRWNVSVD